MLVNFSHWHHVGKQRLLCILNHLCSQPWSLWPSALQFCCCCLLLLRKVVLAIGIPVHCKQSSFALCLWALVGEWITISSLSTLPLASTGSWRRQMVTTCSSHASVSWCWRRERWGCFWLVHSVCASENGAFSLCQWKQISVDVDCFF